VSSARNIEGRHELETGRIIIDPRTAAERFAEWLSDPGHLVACTVPVALVTAVYPLLAILTIPFMVGATIAHRAYREVLPIRYPRGKVEPNGKPGEGILYVGEIDSSSPYERFKEIWLSDNDLRMHMLILGSTGSGKSEALKTIFYNALCWSSGFFIADGKADNKLPTDTYTMVRSVGRDADYLCLNFLLAGNTPEQVRRSRRRRTNKLNPFSSADADTIIQMGSNLLPKVEGDAKNWQEKALNLWRSLVQALCYKRDTQGMDLSVATFIDYMSLSRVEELYIEGYEEAQANHGEWSYGFAGIKNYLESGCPAYQVSKLLKKNGYGDDEVQQNTFGSLQKGKGGKTGKETEQDSMAYEQHAYRTNQLIPVLNLLDKTYGFIFRDKYPEIDMSDVTLRNRVLVMLIPSLEKSAAEAENLGKLAIACLRVMMSKNLGAEVEGDHDELLGSKATNSPYPYVVALDELAYYFSDGIAVMFAQARSLGTCMIAAAQDLEKLTEGSRAAEAGAMLANQVTKFFMRIDDTGKTAEMIQKVVGKATVAVRRSFKAGGFGYSRTSDVDIVQEERVSAQRLQKFRQGEGIVNALGRTHFMRWFYMGDDVKQHQVDRFHINRFLQVASPTLDDIAPYSITVDEVHDPYRKGQELVRMLRQEVSVAVRVPSDPVLQALSEAALRMDPFASPDSRAVALYVAFRAALRNQGKDPAAGASSNSESQAHKQAPRASNGMDGFAGAEPSATSAEARALAHPAARITPNAAATGEAEDVDPDFAQVDALAAMRNQPFERKPADALLALVEVPVDAVGATDPEVGILDPLKSLQLGPVRHLRVDPSQMTGKMLSHLIGAPEAIDEDTGLSLAPRDDHWISAGVGEALQMLDKPRSSDNTVVGLNAPTLDRVEEAEALLGSPNPKQAARTLEHVVAAKVTPNTAPKVGPDDGTSLPTWLDDLEERLR
jgi:intracellular multiplication protein IcmO